MTEAPDHIWITPYVPDDADLLAAIAEVTLRHSHLDHMLRMMVKSLTGVDVRTAISATKRIGSARLRDRVLRLAKKRLGDGTDFVRLEDILNRCAILTAKRNRLTHNIWAQQLSDPDVGKQMVQNDELEWEAIPTVDDIQAITGEIRAIQEEMNHARLHGWLRDALDRSATGPQ